MRYMEVGFTPRRGDIVWAELEQQTGSVTYGRRPVLIIGDNAGNASSPNVHIVIGTNGFGKELQSTQVLVPADRYGLELDTCFEGEQINTISKALLREYIGTLVNTNYLDEIEKSVARALGLGRFLGEPTLKISYTPPAPPIEKETAMPLPPNEPCKCAVEPLDIPVSSKEVQGPRIYRGLIHYTCPSCGSLFFFINKDQPEITCRKCGTTHTLENMVKFRAECGCCENKSYGWTNADTAEIEVKCKCGNPLTLLYSSKRNMYEG